MNFYEKKIDPKDICKRIVNQIDNIQNLFLSFINFETFLKCFKNNLKYFHKFETHLRNILLKYVFNIH